MKVSNGESWSKTLRDVVPPRMFDNLLVKKKKSDSPETSDDDDEENTEKNENNDDVKTESIPETTIDISMTD